jgi:restriction system protein
MAIPDYQALMMPVLALAGQGEVRVRDAVERIGAELGLSAEEREELLPSGMQTVFSNRVHWAKTYLGKAGLLSMPKRSFFAITERGREVLANPPALLNTAYLKRFPEFLAFQAPRQTFRSAPDLVDEREQSLAPDEQMRAARDALEQELAADLLSRILAGSPSFFERVVVNLLIAMGYGGSAQKAGRELGKSGDGGVDGVIDEDVLGLDRIYVQAKRYAPDNTVGPGEIRDFFGALDQFKAGKGLFVTTSRFTDSARATVQKLSKRIVLVDGEELTRLMISYGVGCRVEETIAIKKLDEEFFE